MPTAIPPSSGKNPAIPAGSRGESPRSLEEVSDPAGIASLSDPWARLEAGLSLGPFGSHAWNLARVECPTGRQEQPWVFVGRSAGDIDAIAPLVRVRGSFNGTPVRTLRFIGGRESCRKSLLIRGDPVPFVEDLIERLANRRRPGWDILLLDDVPSDAAWIGPLRRACAARDLHMQDTSDSTNRYIELPHRYEAFRATLKPSLKRNLRRRNRQLEGVGRVEFLRFSADECTSRQLESAARIEAASWKGASGLGIFQANGGLRFHKRLLAARHRGFEPDLAFLTLNEEPIAFQYGFMSGNVYYAYNTSFDPRFGAYSPGILVMDALIRELIEGGVKTCDLLVGESPYKADLTDTFRVNRCLTVFNRTLYGRLLHRLAGLRDRVGILRARGLRPTTTSRPPKPKHGS